MQTQTNAAQNETQSQRIARTMQNMATLHSLWREIEEDAKRDAYNFDNATQ